MRVFCEIYKENPEIGDVDAMIAFIQREKVIKSYRELDTISQEIRNDFELGFSENLKPFIQEYAKLNPIGI